MKGRGVLLIACCLVLFGAETLSATNDVRYALLKPLEVGDVLSAWGVYSSLGGERFSVNIVGRDELILLHMDFRPSYGYVALNSRFSSGWQTELRAEFDPSQFVDGTIFKVCVEVNTDEYRIFLNGEELSPSFPHSVPYFAGSAVELYGGDGFMWSALHLPNYPAAPGLPFSVSSAVPNTLDRPMLPGDIITVWGIYATGSSKFNLNFLLEGGEMEGGEILLEGGENMLHVDFRPDENEVVLNSYQAWWQTELRTPLPAFANGQMFQVQITCKMDEFYISVDGVELASFPYREGLALEDVAFVVVRGGSAGMVWTDLELPGPPPWGPPPF